MKKSQLSVFGALMLIAIALFAILPVKADNNQGYTPGIEVIDVKVNSDSVTPNETIRTQFLRGNELEVRVKLQSSLNDCTGANTTEPCGYLEDVEVSAMIVGDEHFDISDTTETFDVEPGVVYTKDLTLKLPDGMEQDNYKLRVLVSDRYSSLNVYNYNLVIDTDKNSVVIKDVTFNPENDIKAGRSLIAVARIKNMGENDEEGIKVRFEIPDLGIAATDYIDELEADDSVSTEELYVRIPTCAKPGTYDAVVTVTYNDGFDETEETYDVKVVAGDTCETTGTGNNQNGTTNDQTGKVIVTVGSASQDVTKGEGGAIFPITIQNTATTSKQYALTVENVDVFGSYKISPSASGIINAGETKTLYVFVAAKESAAAGAQGFVAKLTVAGQEQSIPFTANIVDAEASTTGLVKGLEIGLIVLAILLIVLGAVVIVKKVKENQETEETTEFSQTYY